MRNTGRLEICEVVDSRSASKASAGKQKNPQQNGKSLDSSFVSFFSFKVSVSEVFSEDFSSRAIYQMP